MAVSTEWRKARLTRPEYAMLEFGEKLTVLPSGMQAADVARLREHGFDDRAILSITLAAAYRNFITRLADALGAELRRDAGYAPEILRAFGVTEHEARTTIYGDRLTARDPETKSLPHPRGAGSRPIAASSICWIDTAPPDAGRFDRLRAELERLTAPWPRRHLALAFGLRPEALDAALSFGRLLGMGGSGLGRRLEAIIGLAVAATLWVPYLGVHHAQAFLDAGASPEEVDALVGKPAEGALVGREREAARFCEKLARLPGAMARSDVEALRAHGFADRDILTIAASAAYESFLCGIAAALGTRLEEEAFAPAARNAFEG
ncbi:MAG: carboxymuconolactone decarboxylase family protein [Dehalococcoidia bacterium]|nr:carboxymuconolactone decarboxylase family protein [Dehalococcoidia bacterium]